jgi:hypothetical protein
LVRRVVRAQNYGGDDMKAIPVPPVLSAVEMVLSAAIGNTNAPPLS